jgi:F-type H+-transporting ATPase subunit delta
MASKRAASRYAKALLGLASERDELVRVESELHMISTLVDESREFELLLTSPVIKPDKKKAVLKAIFKDGLCELTFKFINILVTKGRESLLPSIVQEALSQLRIMKNIQVVEVKTTTPLDDASRSNILAEVAKLHDGEVELTETIDADLLGGFILRMDDKQIDASIKRQLNTLRRKLTEHDYEPEI